MCTSLMSIVSKMLLSFLTGIFNLQHGDTLEKKLSHAKKFSKSGTYSSQILDIKKIEQMLI